jgi:hypothetical protein
MKIQERENHLWNRNWRGGSVTFKFGKNSLAESLQIIADKIKFLSAKYESDKFRIDDLYLHMGSKYGTANLDWKRDLRPEEKKKFSEEEKQRNLKYDKQHFREIKKEAKKLKII